MRKIAGMLVLSIAILMVGAPIVFAQGIKERMIERLPIIKELKNRGIVGEDNRGFLRFIGTAEERKDLVAAENQDRKTVYEAIARQQGTTIDVVEKIRARQIAEKAQPGEWLQDEKGNWYQKK